ncbi:hypothetical protein [Streptomyces sp. NBC_01353]|uniref:hypothetical protein n=1 Tax=Streptomyces sp. NBC_01353 TaxID=2903835 RepID=UPI002E3153AB|nr:hypothetical protein [Streptomyces sp. NBC_01353]
MTVAQVVRRGIRLGVRITVGPAGFFGLMWLVYAVAWLFTGMRGDALAGILRGVVAVGGTMAVGVLLGAATGGALALAPDRLTARAPLRGLLAGAVASALFLPETLVVAFATDLGYLPTLLTFLATPIVGAVSAAHSGDLVGRTRHHPWLWVEGQRQLQS